MCLAAETRTFYPTDCASFCDCLHSVAVPRWVFGIVCSVPLGIHDIASAKALIANLSEPDQNRGIIVLVRYWNTQGWIVFASSNGNSWDDNPKNAALYQTLLVVL